MGIEAQRPGFKPPNKLGRLKVDNPVFLVLALRKVAPDHNDGLHESRTSPLGLERVA